MKTIGNQNLTTENSRLRIRMLGVQVPPGALPQVPGSRKKTSARGDKNCYPPESRGTQVGPAKKVGKGSEGSDTCRICWLMDEAAPCSNCEIAALRKERAALLADRERLYTLIARYSDLQEGGQ